MRYESKANKQNEIPEPAKAALEPKDVENNEQLFLTGLHLEQYRHATYSPVPYYEEALRRILKTSVTTMHLANGCFAEVSLPKANLISAKRLKRLLAATPTHTMASLIIIWAYA